ERIFRVQCADQPRRSAASGERLDLLRGANELNHHHETEQHERDVENERAGRTEPDQIGERPASGKGRAGHFRADADRRAHDCEHVDPDDLAVLAEVTHGGHSWRSLLAQVTLGAGHVWRWVLVVAAMSLKPKAQSSRN